MDASHSIEISSHEVLAGVRADEGFWLIDWHWACPVSWVERREGLPVPVEYAYGPVNVTELHVFCGLVTVCAVSAGEGIAANPAPAVVRRALIRYVESVLADAARDERRAS